jgi:hypothetical protein
VVVAARCRRGFLLRRLGKHAAAPPTPIDIAFLAMKVLDLAGVPDDDYFAANRRLSDSGL